MHLIERIVAEVNKYWAHEVQILGIWSIGPESACVVHRRYIDKPTIIIGHKYTFDSRMADGTLDGFARAIALDLEEPLGAAAEHTRMDSLGILWAGIPADEPTPSVPAEVQRTLGVK